MGGLYSRNRLFDKYCLAGTENLPALENSVRLDGAVSATAWENYETALEECWSEFIKDMY